MYTIFLVDFIELQIFIKKIAKDHVKFDIFKYNLTRILNA